MKCDIKFIIRYLKNIMDTSPSSDLAKKLFTFIKKSSYSEKQSIIKKLIDLGVGDQNTPWELTNIDELKIYLESAKNQSLIIN